MVMSYTKGIFIFGHTVYAFKEFLKISIAEKEIRKTTEECGIKQWLIASVKMHGQSYLSFFFLI